MDPEITADLARIEVATQRLLATIATLTDEQAREPSLLPGWTRGHVLTHIARNADAMVNVLRGAQAGTGTRMYASPEARNAAIEAGAGRPAAALAADLRDSAGAFAAEAALVPASAWRAPARALTGPPFPASGLPLRRLGEVEIHHADLGLAYRPSDWPEEFVATYFQRVARSLAGREDVPPCRLRPAGAEATFPVGPAGQERAGPLVTGPLAALLAWLLGRGDGSGLTVDAGGALPVLPAWP
jgi:maleylpyruvate isomerase